MNAFRRFVPLSFVALAAASVGCSQSEPAFPRHAVSGTVTIDGEPLTSGFIAFAPEEGVGESHRGEFRTAGGVIQDGRFTIDRDTGPVAGPQRVQITSTQPTGKTVRHPDNPRETVAETREAVPPRYNVRTELVAEVKPGADNTFAFRLARDKGNSRQR